MPVTAEQLKRIFEGSVFHRAYKETNDVMKALKVHADGVMPETLIRERRPSESLETFEYRKKIYEPVTKEPIGKVLSSLSKIRRSPDWMVRYDEKSVPPAVVRGESLQDYCEKNYPGHTSVTNWIFSVLLKTVATDANAVIAVFPLNFDAGERNEYYRPQAVVFNSDQVYFFEEGADYAVLRSSERSTQVPADTDASTAQVFYYLTTTEFFKYEQTGTGFSRTQFIRHNFNALPVFKVKAVFLRQKENVIIQESRLAPMLPKLNEAAREYSDLQAAVVQHMHPLFWYITKKECGHCNGTGKIWDKSSPSPCQKPCTVCEGSGRIKFSPYAHLQIDPPKLDEKAFTGAPAGYIGRDVEIMKLQDDRVRRHNFDALASINMQFMEQTPLNISGDAKAVDREELTNFVYSVAEDLVQIMDSTYWWINEWRYSLIVPDKEKREAMLPEIPVPEQFDLLPADYLMDQIGKARTAKTNPLLIAAMEEEYAEKKLYNVPELADVMRVVYNLDPLPGLTVDEKNAAIMNKGATQEDYVISTYIVPFVKRAIAEDKNFLAKPFVVQYEVMKKYAGEKTKVIDAAEQAKQNLLAKQMELANGGGQNSPATAGAN